MAGEHPYMVGLVSSGTDSNFDGQFCGGSVIDPEWVLTAAHCVVTDGFTAPADTIDVLVGAIDLTLDEGERVPLADIVAHPDYNEVTSQNDIALLHLQAPLAVAPVAFAGADDLALEEPGTIVTLTGWGGLLADLDNQEYATVLQVADMPLISADDCVSLLDAFDGSGAGIDPETMLCAGAPESDADGGIDACFGDSGGPLVATAETGLVQVGVVSFGPTCGQTPSAYTRVTTYAEWITDTLAGGGQDDSDLAHVDRVAGANRYATAATLATQRFATELDTVFVTTGSAFPDALAAAPAAANLQAPILLVERDRIPDETRAAISTLAPAAIIAVGGPAVISDAIVAELGTLTRSGGIRRIAGASRYESAAFLAEAAFPTPVGDEGLPIFVASGESFADALSGAGAAASVPPVPLLLTMRDVLPAATSAELARHHPSAVFVLGGPAAVSNEVIAEIEALGIDVARIAGADRYETSAQIVTFIFGAADEVFVATGSNFPDGLVSGALGLPLLLLPPTGIPQPVADAVQSLGASTATVLGGTGAVSDEQAAALDELLSS